MRIGLSYILISLFMICAASAASLPVSPAPRPLILWLHGCTQSAEKFLQLTELNEKQSQLALDAIILTPEQSYFKNPLACWNWFLSNTQKRGEGKLQEITNQIQTLIQQGVIDPEQVYVGGFSAGGVLAAHFAYCYPDMFKAALIHSGAPYKLLTLPKHEENDLGKKSFNCARGVSKRRLKDILIVNGSKDWIANSHVLKKSIEQALYFLDETDDGKQNASMKELTLKTPEIRRWVSPKEHSLNLVRVPEMGHAWSGGNKDNLFSSEYTVNATDLFLELIRLNN